jgi:hypothetical protein
MRSARSIAAECIAKSLCQGKVGPNSRAFEFYSAGTSPVLTPAIPANEMMMKVMCGYKRARLPQQAR